MSSTDHHPDYQELCDRARELVREIDPLELHKLRGVMILDVRDRLEAAEGMLDGAMVVPRGELEKLVGAMGIEPDRELVLYCQSGNRSVLACRTLDLMGFHNTCSLRGGIDAWREAGLPVDVPSTRQSVV